MAFMQVDFQDSLRKAQQISQLSGEVRTTAQSNIDDIEKNIPSVWSGDGADKYRKKINKISTRVKNRADMLQRNASGLKTSANRMKRAEEYALSLFSKK